LSAWLRAHPGVEVVSRDRSPTYASGITEGAPTAVQVADRFHLLMNVRKALEEVVKRWMRLLRVQRSAAPATPAPAPGRDASAGCRLRLEPHLLGARRAATGPPTPQPTLPSACEVAWMLLRGEELADDEKPVVELLRRRSPEAPRAQELAVGFVGLIKERRACDLRGWLIEAGRSGVAEFRSFANGITSDFQAVRAALEYEWSQGQVEGQVHRLKLVKRQMYGRGKLDLLRARVLYAA